MTMQPGFADRMPQARPGRDAGRVLRVLALIAVAIGLAAITAAACVLSYSSIHHLATAASVSPRLARLYPLIFDALLVLAGCSVLALRGAGLVSRVYSWLCLLVLLGALAGGGAVRAAAVKVPHRLAGILAAVIPWALVLIGFGLLLALLRYARIRRLGQQPAEPERQAGQDAEPGELVVIGSETAPPERAAGPAAIVPGFTRTPATPGPGVRPALTRTAGSPETPTAPHPTTPVQAAPAPVAPAQVAPAPVAPAPVAPAEVPPAQAPPVEVAPLEAPPVQAAQPEHAAVRQADLQLKARVPRQPAGQQAQASPAEARHAPFMPPVGPRPAAEAPAGSGAAGSGAAGSGAAGVGAGAAAGAAEATRAGEAPGDGATRAGEAPRDGATRASEPAGGGDTSAGQAQVAAPGTPLGASGSAQQTNPRLFAEGPASTATTAENPPPENAAAASESPQDDATADEPDASTLPPSQDPADLTATEHHPAAAVHDHAAAEPGTAAGIAPADAPVTANSLNAAPVNDDEEAEPGAPPALNRPRSSPTPPED